MDEGELIRVHKENLKKRGRKKAVKIDFPATHGLSDRPHRQFRKNSIGSDLTCDRERSLSHRTPSPPSLSLLPNTQTRKTEEAKMPVPFEAVLHMSTSSLASSGLRKMRRC